jgi:hypothetical protein
MALGCQGVRKCKKFGTRWSKTLVKFYQAVRRHMPLSSCVTTVRTQLREYMNVWTLTSIPDRHHPVVPKTETT